MASVLDNLPFAIFTTSVLSSKLLHLYQHGSSVTLLSFIVFLPSLFVIDIIFISGLRLLLRRERRIAVLLGYIFGLFITITTLSAASAQLGFFYETGGEIAWKDALGFARDEEGRKVLMDGSTTVSLAAFMIVVVSFLIRTPLYRIAGDFLAGCAAYIVLVWRTIRGFSKPSSKEMLTTSTYGDSMTNSVNRDSLDTPDVHESYGFLEGGMEKPTREKQVPRMHRKTFLAGISVGLGFITLSLLIRPAVPYNHMSTTLPLPLLRIFEPPSNPCEEQALIQHHEWPLPELVAKKHWRKPSSNFKGWSPGGDTKWAEEYKHRVPPWSPQPPPSGFERWAADKTTQDQFVVTANKVSSDGTKNMSCSFDITEDRFYSPVTDPLKISNLDNDFLEPIREAINNDSIKVKHVVYILMESMKEEMFPLVQGSNTYDFVMDSHKGEGRWNATIKKLAKLTPNANKITGRGDGYKDSNGDTVNAGGEGEWNDTTAAGFGGINIQGGYTAASVSTKSVAANHCGTWPLPVDKFEEAELGAYQPCLPQIFKFFNALKTGEESNDDSFLEQEWAPAFFQATTDHYDRQDKFGEKMGFDFKVTREELRTKRLGKANLERVNYFGYPETALRPYIHEYINKTLSENKRMFLSHFTSTTHHKWGTPKAFKNLDYFNMDHDPKKYMEYNKYLNTVRFVDTWLGEMMQTLDDYGIANETLVVFVGDHGQTFTSDTGRTGTYENGHMWNYRVPMMIRHPHLPRMQHHVNASSISMVPTILDLLISTKSLNEKDAEAASDFVQDYEGQSLIREYKTHEDGRRAWNFGITNSGGGLLAITSADTDWRLIMPMSMEIEFVFTNAREDPWERDPTEAWTLDALVMAVSEIHGEEAATWAKEAEAVGRWFVLERKRLWGYNKLRPPPPPESPPGPPPGPPPDGLPRPPGPPPPS